MTRSWSLPTSASGYVLDMYVRAVLMEGLNSLSFGPAVGYQSWLVVKEIYVNEPVQRTLC